MGSKTIPTVIGVIFLIVGVAAGVLLVQQRQIFRLGAAGGVAPLEVQVSNVTDTSFTVTWYTDKDAIGQISWGANSQLGKTARPEDASAKKIHSVSVRGLSPGTNYYFVVNSGGQDFDDNGIAWEVKTSPTLSSPPASIIISGTVVGPGGAPAASALVYASTSDSLTVSTLTSSDGKWVLPISTARNKLASGYAKLDEKSTININVQAGSRGVATAQAYYPNANPLPVITLGQAHDFRDTANVTFSNPSAQLSLPEDTDKTSRFTVDGQAQTTGEAVTLDSVIEGEVVYTTKPEFFGSGDPGLEFNITVESDPVTDSIVVPSNGVWKWSPPVDLEPGEHTVTITWRDALGVLQKLTQTFEVLAAEEEPSFESTPSGETPTPAPSATPTPTPTPSATVSATPRPTDRVSIPSTDSGIPVAGSLTPTLLLSSMGIGLLLIGFYVSLKVSK